MVRHSRFVFSAFAALLIVAGAGTSGAQVFERAWGTYGTAPGQFVHPLDIGVDANGVVFVLDSGTRRVSKWTRNGEFLGQWGEDGTGFGQFRDTYGMGIGPQGHVWVADPSNNVVIEFTADGAPVRQLGGTYGGDDGQLRAPFDAAQDARGNVYVVEWDSARLQKFDMSGAFLTKWFRDGETEASVAVDGYGHVYAAGRTSGWALGRFTDTGTSLGALSGMGTPGFFYRAHGFTTDAAGHVFVIGSADDGVGRVIHFSSDGAFVAQWGSRGTGPGQFVDPSGIAVDAEGSVYVVDTGNARIQKFSPVPVPTQSTTWGRIKSLYR